MYIFKVRERNLFIINKGGFLLFYFFKQVPLKSNVEKKKTNIYLLVNKFICWFIFQKNLPIDIAEVIIFNFFLTYFFSYKTIHLYTMNFYQRGSARVEGWGEEQSYTNHLFLFLVKNKYSQSEISFPVTTGLCRHTAGASVFGRSDDHWRFFPFLRQRRSERDTKRQSLYCVPRKTSI